MMQRNPIYLRFPDRVSALAVGAALIGAESIEQLVGDGWHEGTYWCLDDIGTLYEPTGAVDSEGLPVYAALPGYHVNGLWCGDMASLPAALGPFIIYPASPQRVWG